MALQPFDNNNTTNEVEFPEQFQLSHTDTFGNTTQERPNPEPGESTPLLFAPPDNPIHENPSWSLVLDEIIERLISTVHGATLGTRASSLPPTTVEQTATPVDTIQGTPGSTIDHSTGQTCRPANRDAPNDDPTGNSLRTCKLNECFDCSPGDSEKLEGPTHGSPYQQSNPDKDRTRWLSDRQSPNHTVLLAHQGDPPDEEIKPKRVADDKRPSSLPPSHFSPIHFINVNAPPPLSADTETPQITALQQSVTHSSTRMDPRQEYTEGPDGPQPTVHEETVEEPVRSATQQIHSILTKRRMIIDQMSTKIIHQVQEMRKCMVHLNTITTQISCHTRWESIRPLFINLTPSSPDPIRTTVIEPLSQIVIKHYNHILNAHLQGITSAIQNTQNSLDQLDIPHHTDKAPSNTRALTDSILNLSNYLRVKFNSTETLDTIHATDSHTLLKPVTVENTDNEGHDDQSAMPSNKINRKSLKQRITHHKPHSSENCVNSNCFECAKDNVVNLSNIELTRNQIILLSKGLSFVPTTSDANPKEILKDFNQFTIRTKIKLRKFINPPRSPRPNDEPALVRTNPTSYNDTNTRLGPQPLENAFEAMRMDISKLTLDKNKSHKHNDNLTRNEKLALKQLAANHNLVINKADKGSTIVVRHKDDYIQEGLTHLSDTKTYMRLDRDYTLDVAKLLRITLEQYKKRGLLSPRMTNYCLPPNQPRTAQLYFLKKIHKCPMGIRPIVSSVNSATENLAEFLDYYLQPIMQQLPAYLKDTTQFIRETTPLTVHHDTWLVTVDVKSLYTNIPNDEGIQACYEAWKTQELTHPQHPPAEVLRHLLELVLKLNTLEFNEQFYLQTFGTAMGSRLAPAYANTFMGSLEKSILESSPLKPSYYRRFIDDIFMIWPHSLNELDKFISHMNTANPSIQFTHEKSQEEITFLDVTVYKQKDPMDDNQTKLQFKTHIKSTNKQLYIREDSYHPPGTTKGVTIGEAIRYLRTNSERKSFQQMLLTHKRNLAKRGYPTTRINKQLKNIQFSMRTSKALHDKNQKNKHTTVKPNKPVFTTRYCPNAMRAFRSVYKHWTSISTDNIQLRKFLSQKTRLAYRANPNLANKLVRAKLKQPTDHNTPNTSTEGEHPRGHIEIGHKANLKHAVQLDTIHPFPYCPDHRCPLHGRMIPSNLVRSRISKRSYKTRGNANCNTQYTIYLIQCRQCGRQYVGQTAQPLKKRILKHINAIKDKNRPGTLHEHFRAGKCSNTKNLSLQVLHVLLPEKEDTPEMIESNLKSLETLWIDRLKSEYPQGLNWARYDPVSRHRFYKSRN